VGDGARNCSTADAMPWAMTVRPVALSASDPSKGSVMYSGSMTTPGMRLGVEKKPAMGGPISMRWS
jgi:hypothetical protein